MVPLIQKHYLEELRLENCDMSIDVLDKLIEKIYDKSFINTLGLVNLKFNKDSYKKLCDFLLYQ